MDHPSFEELADFIREWRGISRKKSIVRETQFERDLGITGDDGGELLQVTEKQFNVTLASDEDGYRKTFNLGPSEYLFHSEGFGPFPFELLSILSPAPTVRAFSAGELYDAVVKELTKAPPRPYA